MKKVKGITLIEVMIIVVIIGILAASLIFALSGDTKHTPSKSSVSYGVGGMVETRCIDGYRFIIGGQDGSVRQVMDSLGRGVKCDPETGDVIVEETTTEETQ